MKTAVPPQRSAFQRGDSGRIRTARAVKIAAPAKLATRSKMSRMAKSFPRGDRIPSHVTLHSELNELEQQNILEADTGTFLRRRYPVNEPFGRNLHRRMFRDVWCWAGTYRRSDKSIGVQWQVIQPRLYEALEQTRYWIENKTFPPDEIVVSFHHSLVFIHPFPNGNGRWSRLMADILLVKLGQKRFTWGGS